jgi:CxxC motif-containing protein
MEKNFVCIICPRGCRIKVDDEGVITGNFCKRGIGYVKTEMTAPTRVVTTTVKTIYPELPRISVKTDKPIPKGLIYDIMEKINETIISKPMAIGEILIENILDTGSNIVLTKPCLK